MYDRYWASQFIILYNRNRAIQVKYCITVLGRVKLNSVEPLKGESSFKIVFTLIDIYGWLSTYVFRQGMLKLVRTLVRSTITFTNLDLHN